MQVFPIMGAGYHSIHHTSYKHNYGHYTIFMDQVFGTMLTPEDEEEDKGGKLERQVSPAGSVSGLVEQRLGEGEVAQAAAH